MTVGASPRGGLALVALARGQAMLDRRDFVTPEDVKAVAVPALAHRISLRPELWVRRVTSADVVDRPARHRRRCRADDDRAADRPRVPPRRRGCAGWRWSPALAVAGAVVTAHGELLVLAVVPLVLLALTPAVASRRETRRTSPPTLSTERCVEGDEVEVVLTVRGPTAPTG